MARTLPPTLLDAVIRALDAEHELRSRRTSRRAQTRRERLLRTVREALDAWRLGSISLEKAVQEIDRAIEG